MWQSLVVGVMVVVASAYSIWYVLPVQLRQRLARVHPALEGAKACSSCRNCGGCSASKPDRLLAATLADGQAIKFYRCPEV